MKQILISLLLFCASHAMIAQDLSYRPLVEGGKRWTYVRSYEHPGYSPYHYWYYLQGDTMIGGQKCLKMFSENYRNDGIERYAGALYEEGKKVYAFLPEHDTADLLYDFNCDVDDEIRTSEGRMLVTEIVQYECGGIGLHYYHLLWLSDDGNRYIEGCAWIEGIGSEMDIFRTVPTDGNASGLYRCELKGEILYKDERTDGITSPSDQSLNHRSAQGDASHLKNSANSNFLDLSGRRLPTLPTRKGIYIKDGRKVLIK